YRRDIEDMPADRREIEEAMEEGIRIHTLACPDEFVGRESAEKLICSGMELKGFDRDGRKNPIRIENSRYEVELDLIIPAVSQYSDLPFVRKEEVEVTKWGTFIVDENMKITAMDKVFAGGDVVRGSDVVITAIADGKKAAVCIDRFLGGEGILNKGSAIDIPDVHDDGELVEHERFACKYLDPDKRKDNFNEVAMGYHKLNAIAESMRCLHCDRKSL
ncbi:MAG: FAD-dependent oxidoreductase, partial [Clostridia bacterium]